MHTLRNIARHMTWEIAWNTAWQSAYGYGIYLILHHYWPGTF